MEKDRTVKVQIARVSACRFAICSIENSISPLGSSRPLGIDAVATVDVRTISA